MREGVPSYCDVQLFLLLLHSTVAYRLQPTLVEEHWGHYNGQLAAVKRGRVTARTCLQSSGTQSDRDRRRQDHRLAHYASQATLTATPSSSHQGQPQGGVWAEVVRSCHWNGLMNTVVFCLLYFMLMHVFKTSPQ